MNSLRITLFVAFAALLAACTKETPPRTVSELLSDPLLLEAALVRCTQNRNETRYEAECINAREAVKQIEAKEEEKRRAAFEVQSQRKREALRRTQRAAAEARRRVREEEKRRRDEEYLAQFGELPPGGDDGLDGQAGNVPTAVIPEASDDAYSDDSYEQVPPVAGSIAPVVESAPPPPAESVEQAPVTAPQEMQSQPAPEIEADLDSIRDELRRRNDDSSS